MADKIFEFSGRGMATGKGLQFPQGRFSLHEMATALPQATKILVELVKLAVQAAKFLLVPGVEIVSIRTLLQIIEHSGQHDCDNVLSALQDTSINRFQADKGFGGKRLERSL